jgi:hypothetical protein
MSNALFDRLGIGINVKFVFYQFSRNSRHVSGLPCKDVPIFLKEFNECEFLFRIQIVSHMSDFGGVTQGKWDGLGDIVLWLDGRLGSLGLGHDRVHGGGGGLGHGLLQVLEFY